MKKTFLFFSTIVLAFIVLSGCTQEAVDVKTEIEAANVTFMEAVNTGDIEALTNIYLPDAILCPPNSEMISGVENAVAAMTATPPGMVKMVFETVSAEANGDTAIELGKYKVLSPDEATVFDYGKYIVIWKKKGDEWKVSKDIWNTSMPAAPKAAPGDNVLVGVTTAKPELLEKFDEFQNEIFLPAFKELYPDTYSATRILKTAEADKNGNYYFIYISDPFTDTQVHNVWTVLNEKYGKDETQKIWEKYKDLLSDQKAYVAVEQVW